jgi:hypothetical protein
MLLRRVALASAVLALGACQKDGRNPMSPAETPSSSPASSIWSPAEPVMIVEGLGVAPEGFRTLIVSEPKRDAAGEIHGVSPLTVEFDACRSSAGAGQTAYFYFDWDMDSRADAWGTEDACRKAHTYRLKPVEDAEGEETIRTNVCVTNGDLRLHDPDTFISCREFAIVMMRVAPPSGAGAAARCHSVHAAGTTCPTGATEFCVDDPPVSATNRVHAQAACEACYGLGTCFDLNPTGIGGAVWLAPFTQSAYFYETATGPGQFCTGVTPQAGEITDTLACVDGRWAP